MMSLNGHDVFDENLILPLLVRLIRYRIDMAGNDYSSESGSETDGTVWPGKNSIIKPACGRSSYEYIHVQNCKYVRGRTDQR